MARDGDDEVVVEVLDELALEDAVWGASCWREARSGTNRAVLVVRTLALLLAGTVGVSVVLAAASLAALLWLAVVSAERLDGGHPAVIAGAAVLAANAVLFGIATGTLERHDVVGCGAALAALVLPRSTPAPVPGAPFAQLAGVMRAMLFLATIEHAVLCRASAASHALAYFLRKQAAQATAVTAANARDLPALASISPDPAPSAPVSPVAQTPVAVGGGGPGRMVRGEEGGPPAELSTPTGAALPTPDGAVAGLGTTDSALTSAYSSPRRASSRFTAASPHIRHRRGSAARSGGSGLAPDRGGGFVAGTARIAAGSDVLPGVTMASAARLALLSIVRVGVFTLLAVPEGCALLAVYTPLPRGAATALAFAIAAGLVVAQVWYTAHVYLRMLLLRPVHSLARMIERLTSPSGALGGGSADGSAGGSGVDRTVSSDEWSGAYDADKGDPFLLLAPGYSTDTLVAATGYSVPTVELAAAALLWRRRPQPCGSASVVPVGGSSSPVSTAATPGSRRGSGVGLDAMPNQMLPVAELELLRRYMRRMWRLVQVGFGEAGHAVVARYLSRAGMGGLHGGVGLQAISSAEDAPAARPSGLRGEKVHAIFMFCDIRSFTQITEGLQEEVLAFVNDVADVVHAEVAAAGGAPNKNIGDAFLLTWKLPDAPISMPVRGRRVSAIESLPSTIAGPGRHASVDSGKTAPVTAGSAHASTTGLAPPERTTTNTGAGVGATIGRVNTSSGAGGGEVFEAPDGVPPFAPATSAGGGGGGGGGGGSTNPAAGPRSTVMASWFVKSSQALDVVMSAERARDGGRGGGGGGGSSLALRLPGQGSLLGMARSSRRSLPDTSATNDERGSGETGWIGALGRRSSALGSAPANAGGSATAGGDLSRRASYVGDEPLSLGVPPRSRLVELAGYHHPPGAPPAAAPSLLPIETRSVSSQASNITGDGGAGRGGSVGNGRPPRGGGTESGTEVGSTTSTVATTPTEAAQRLPLDAPALAAPAPAAPLAADSHTSAWGLHDESGASGGDMSGHSARASLSLNGPSDLNLLSLPPVLVPATSGEIAVPSTRTGSAAASPRALGAPATFTPQRPGASEGAALFGAVTPLVASPALARVAPGASAEVRAPTAGAIGAVHTEGAVVVVEAGLPAQGDDSEAAGDGTASSASSAASAAAGPLEDYRRYWVRTRGPSGGAGYSMGSSSAGGGGSSGGVGVRVPSIKHAMTRHASRLVMANPYRQRDGIQALSNNALAAAVNIVVRMCAANQPGGRLAHYRRNPALVEADFAEFRLGFGLHIGYAVEGAIGTHLKIDASYLSPSVNATARLESATRMYDVDIIVSEQFAQCLSGAAQNTLRLIDRVLLKGVAEPMALFTFDWDRETALRILRGGQARPAAAGWAARHAWAASQTGLAAAIGSELVAQGSHTPPDTPPRIGGSIDGIRALVPASLHDARTRPPGSNSATSTSPIAVPPSVPGSSSASAPSAPPPLFVLPPLPTPPLPFPVARPPRIVIPTHSRNSVVGLGVVVVSDSAVASSSPTMLAAAGPMTVAAARVSAPRSQRRAIPYVHLDANAGDAGLRDAMAGQLITELARLQPESVYPTAFFEHAEAAVGYYVGDPEVNWEAARAHARLALDLRPRDGPLTMQLAYMDRVGVGDTKCAPPWWQGFRPFDSK